MSYTTTIWSPNSLNCYHIVTHLSTLLPLCHPTLYAATILSPNVLHYDHSVTQLPMLLSRCHPEDVVQSTGYVMHALLCFKRFHSSMFGMQFMSDNLQVNIEDSRSIKHTCAARVTCYLLKRNSTLSTDSQLPALLSVCHPEDVIHTTDLYILQQAMFFFMSDIFQGR